MSWTEIERWFAEHHPALPLRLRPPATPEQIASAEATLGVDLPADFRASLAIHDGQDEDPAILWLPYVQRLGSLDSLVAAWKADRDAYDPDPQRHGWLDRTGRVRQVHFHPLQIPIAGSRFWDYDRLLLDFVPGPAGRVGQVIARIDIELVFVCDSFERLLARTAEGLRTGRIVLGPRPIEIGGELEAVCVNSRGRSIAPAKWYGA